jgi:hypothetical protein
VKKIATIYAQNFSKLCIDFYQQTTNEAYKAKIPLLQQTEFIDLQQKEGGCASSITYTYDDFYNKIHTNNDYNLFTYRMWAPTSKLKNGKLAKIEDGFECEGGQFILPSYKCYVEFTNFDGVVEIIWKAKTDLHATLKSKKNENYTRIGTSMQINNNLVLRIKTLLGMQKEGKIINDRICRVNDIFKKKSKKLNNYK